MALRIKYRSLKRDVRLFVLKSKEWKTNLLPREVMISENTKLVLDISWEYRGDKNR